MAFYFAARGEGYEVHPNGYRRTYITPAKVFFSGLGADEQLGYRDPESFWLISVDTLDMQRHGKDRMETGTQ